MKNQILNILNKNIYVQKYKQSFFNKKRVIFISIFVAIFITFIFLTFWGLKINLSDIWNYFVQAFNNNSIALFFIFLALLFPLTRFVYIYSYIRPVLVYNGIHLPFIEYVSLFFKIVAINAVTPFASGSEPYMVYWLTSRGLNINHASMISICNAIYSGITEVIITIPSFVLISLKYDQITNIQLGLIIYWFIFSGLIVNLFVVSIFLISAFSNRTQYYISVFFNFILSKLKMKHLTKDEIRNKYLTNHLFKAELFKMIKSFKYASIIILTYAIFTIYYYFTFYFSLESLNIDEINFSGNFGLFFNLINVAVTANNFVPIPGGEGTIQLTLATLTSIFDPSLDLTNNYINNVVGFWRILTTYIPLIVSLGGVFVYYFSKIYLIKCNQRIKMEFKI